MYKRFYQHRFFSIPRILFNRYFTVHVFFLKCEKMKRKWKVDFFGKILASMLYWKLRHCFFLKRWVNLFFFLLFILEFFRRPPFLWCTIYDHYYLNLLHVQVMSRNHDWLTDILKLNRKYRWFFSHFTSSYFTISYSSSSLFY